MGSAPATVHIQNEQIRAVSQTPPRVSPVSNIREIPSINRLKQKSLSSVEYFRDSSVSPNRSSHQEAAKTIDQISEEALSSLLHDCDNDRDRFFGALEEEIAQMYSRLSKQTLQAMNNKTLNNDEAKLHISQTILRTNLKVLKVVGRQAGHHFDMQTFVKFNHLQTQLIRYLMAKYPRNNQSFVPGELLRVFKQFSNVEKEENDIVRASGHYFGSDNEGELIKCIKSFLNRLIDELDTCFPIFQRLLQEKLFTIESEGKKKSVNYKIGRKLPENVARFTDLNSKSLDIKSPQMFRVVIKWVEDMQEFILRPQVVQEKQTFKVVTRVDGRVFCDELNAQDSSDILNALVSKLQSQKTQYNEELQNLIYQLHSFNSTLIKILQRGDRKEKYIPRDEAALIKFASYNTRFLQWMLAEKLMIILKRLVRIGKSFRQKDLVTLDLVRFNVTDMMRAMMTGSKKEVLAVYENVKRLSNANELTIIKLKNRLSTPLNDAMIIFRIKGSFLICELQLILSDTVQGANEKLKNVQTLNHFFYELQRSPYGALSELSVLMGYKDSRVSFANKVHYQNRAGQFQSCEEEHPKHICTFYEQLHPFICSQCCEYYTRLQNLFLMKTCTLCNNSLCSRCIFKHDATLFESIRKTQLNDIISKQLAKTVEANRQKKQFSATNIQLNSILDKLNPQIIYLKNIIPTSKDSITVNQFQNYLSQRFISISGYLILVQYFKSQMSLTPLQFNIYNKEIVICFEPFSDFYKNKTIKFLQYDYLLFYKDDLKIDRFTQEELKKLSVVNLFTKKMEFENATYFGSKIGQHGFFMLNAVEQKKKGQTDDKQRDEEDANKKQFKYESIAQYISQISDLNDAKNFLLLSNLGLRTSHLSYFQKIDWKDHIKQVRISKNKLRDIKPIIDNLPNIKRIYASSNYITEVRFTKKLQLLQTLVLAYNLIKQIDGIDLIPLITRLNFSCNQLQNFPIVKLPELRFLVLSENSLHSKQFLNKCEFPNLLHLFLCQSFAAQHEKQSEKVIIPFRNMTIFKTLQSQMKQLVILSNKIERLECISGNLERLEVQSTKLSYVDLSMNQLKDFSVLFQNQMNTLTQVYLPNNQCNQLPKLQCRFLQVLNLNSNLITDITNLQGSKLSDLKELHLEQNQIKKMCKLEMPNLERFQLCGNQFEELDELAQSNLCNLKSFNLTLSSCKHLPMFKMPSLERLVLNQINIDDMKEFMDSLFPKLSSITFQTAKLRKFPQFKFPAIKQLTINFGKFEDLSGLSEVNLPQLQILLFTYNDYYQQQPQKQQTLSFPKISFPAVKMIKIESSIIMSVNNFVFSNISLLEQLSITCSKLTQFPTLTLAFLKTLNLDSNQLKDLTKLCQCHFPVIDTLTLTSNAIEIINNSPERQGVSLFNNLKFHSLTALSLSTNPLTSLDIVNAPNLISLSFSYCQLPQFPVIVAPALKQLVFYSNPWKNFANLAKCSLPNIPELYFAYGLDETIFEEKVLPVLNFPCLKVFYLNSLVYENIDNMSVSVLPQLQQLEMSTNKITIFPVMKFYKLKSINFSNNQIVDVSALTMCYLHSLQTLELSNNQISTFPAFQAENLTTLILSYNKFTNTQFLRESKLPNLSKLSFVDNHDFNETQQFPQTVKQLLLSRTSTDTLTPVAILPKLTVLECMQCKITRLPHFQSNRYLTDLTLLNNQIQDINDFLQRQYTVLHTLYFSQNKIKSIKAIFKCPELESLNFDTNQLQNVDIISNSHLPKLTCLDLSNNKLKTLPKIPASVSSLYLKQNHFQNLDFTTKLHPDSIFYAFDISYNKIKKMKPIKLLCTSLNLSFNQIESMDWLQTSQIKDLNTLTLNNNNIKKILKIPEKYTGLTSLYLHCNPITDIGQFFKTNSKIIPNLYFFTLTVAPDKMEATKEKFQKLYPNGYLAFYDKAGEPL